MRQILSPLDGIRSPFGRLLGSVFSPAALFALAEPGVWYDPSDLTTLFQDTAGTTPVTTPGQSVALALDKSKGLVLGSELVGTLSAYANASISTSGGVTTITCTSNGSYGVNLGFSGAAGSTYRVSFEVVTNSAPRTVFAWSSISSSVVLNAGTTLGTKSGTLLASVGGIAIIAILGATAGETFSIRNISVKELPGFHATQATAGSRPIYGIVPVGGRRNLLTFTEQFDNAVWTKSATTVTANAATAPDSTTTADFLVETATNAVHFVTQAFTYVSGTTYMHSVYAKSSDRTLQIVLTATSSVFTNAYANYNLQLGTVSASSGATATIQDVGNGWYRCNVFATALASASATIAFAVQNSPTAARSASYTGDGTSGILIWGAQLELGSTATAYQRVVSQYDVTEAGVSSLSYLAFDGVDDFLLTPTITPGIDKAQVFAGVRKLSDAAAGTFIEFSANVGANAGSLWLFAPGSSGGPVAFDWFTRGNAAVAAGQTITPSVATYPAPGTFVLNGSGDIAADNKTLRVNGTVAGTNTSDQGTGNFLAYPLYIGRRGGTTLPFNGNLYSLIVRFGTNLTTDQITSTETWVAGKTGITL